MSSWHHQTPLSMPGWEAVSMQTSSFAAVLLQQLNLLSHVELRGGYGWIHTQDLGDFPEPEARAFFQGLLSNRREPRDTEWASIFEVRVLHLFWCTLCQALSSLSTQVCGGNAGQLITASQYLDTFEDVQAGLCPVLDAWAFRVLQRPADRSPICATALCEIWSSPMSEVEAGLRGQPGWSAAAYTYVVQRLVESPHNAIPKYDLCSGLDMEKRDGEAAVQAMVKANMLAYRTASSRLRAIWGCSLSA